MNRIFKLMSILLVFIWMIIIYVFSAMPSSESNGKSKALIRNAIEKTVIFNEVNLNSDTISENRSLKEKQTESIVEKLNKPLRKCAHAIEYFILAILIYNCLKSYKLNKYKCFILPIAISFLYACIDEWHQLYVIGRRSQFMDVIIDMLGATLGVLLITYIIKLINKGKVKKFKEQ